MRILHNLSFQGEQRRKVYSCSISGPDGRMNTLLLCEYHRNTGNNIQAIKVGDVVQVHNEGSRVYWKLAIIEKLISGNDGLIHAAHIHTRTNHLEITAQEQQTGDRGH